MGWSHGNRWTEEQIEAELRGVAQELGRMPSANELRARGKNDLACAIPRAGGYKAWAERLGLAQKGAATHRGLRIQGLVAAVLRERGFLVDEMTTRAPYDLLVNGKARVDVKSARFSNFPLQVVREDGTTRTWNRAGFVFGLNKAEPTCDLYILCGLDDKDTILWSYYIPADKARVQMITITPEGKYTLFKEDLAQLRKLCE
jgi:hypothetical protein